MALTERYEIDKIELVGPHRIIQVRTARVIEDNGVEIARSYARRVVDADEPDDPSELDEIKAIRGAVHPPSVRTARANERAQSNRQGPGNGPPGRS